jgi:hypothetical protein
MSEEEEEEEEEEIEDRKHGFLFEDDDQELVVQKKPKIQAFVPFQPDNHGRNVAQMRPEYEVKDQVYYFNQLAMIGLMYMRATQGIITPIIYDEENQRLKNSYAIKFDF